MRVDMFSQRREMCASILAYFLFRFSGQDRDVGGHVFTATRYVVGILAYFHFRFQGKIEM